MEPFIADFINNNKIPKPLRILIIIITCGITFTIGILCGLDSKMIIGNILGYILAVLSIIIGTYFILKIKGGKQMTKKIVLYFILLIALSICGTLVLKVYDLIFKVGYENIIMSGFKVGLIAWIGMLINESYHIYKNKSTNK